MASGAGEFGTNGMTLELGPEVGVGLFGGVGFSISGALLQCQKKDNDDCLLILGNRIFMVLNSTHKCNTFLKVNLVWGSPIQTRLG